MTNTPNAPVKTAGAPSTAGASTSKPFKPTVVTPGARAVDLIPRQNRPTFKLFEGPLSPEFHEEIMVSPTAHRKMCTYIRCCSMEVGWLGTVIEHNGLLFIDDVFLLEQEVTGGSTELSEDDMAEFVSDFLNNPPEGMSDMEALDVINSVRMWGHSHVNMGVSPSGTDERTMHNEFARSIPGTDMPFFIRAIGNKKGDLVFDIFYYDLGISLRDVPWMIGVPDYEEEDFILYEMTQKLKYRPVTPKYPNGSYKGPKPAQGTGQTKQGNTEEVVNLPAVPDNPEAARKAAEAMFNDFGLVGFGDGNGWDMWSEGMEDDDTVRGAYNK